MLMCHLNGQSGCLLFGMSDEIAPDASGVSPGPRLALLLLQGFRSLVDAATADLAKHGHPNVRAGHEFAMRAIEGGADSASALAGRLAISKQAAAKTISGLETRGYVMRAIDPADGRRRPLVITPRGRDMLAHGQAILDALRQGWAEQVGEEGLESLESTLRKLVTETDPKLDTAAWFTNEQDPGPA